MKRFLWCIPSLSLALSSSALAQEPIRIGVCVPLSGNLGTAGRLMWEGIRAAHAMRPQALGRPVELKVADTKSGGPDAANGVFRLMERDRVVALIGGMVSGAAIAGLCNRENRGIPLVIPGAASPMLMSAHEPVRRICPREGEQAKRAAVLAWNKLNAETAAVICDMADERSLALAACFTREFTRRGGRILFQARIKTGDRDFTAQVNQMRTARPDVVYAPLYHVECALLARHARNTGVNVPMIAGDAARVPELLEFGGKSLENLMFTSYVHDRAMSAVLEKRFRELCSTRAGKRIHPSQAMGAAAYISIVEAITRACSAEPRRIRDALSASLCFDGIFDTMSADNEGDATRRLLRNAVHFRIHDTRWSHLRNFMRDMR